MRDLASVLQLQNHDNLVINVLKDHNGRLSVSGIEINDSVSNVRFSFKYDAPFHNILSPAVAKSLTELIETADIRCSSIALPDFQLTQGDVQLRGCRMDVSPPEMGVERIALRFDHFEGNVSALFMRRGGNGHSYGSDSIDQAVCALQQVYEPLRTFSLCLNGFLDETPHLLNREQMTYLRQIRGEIEQMSYFTDAITEKVNDYETKQDDLLMVMRMDHIQLSS